MVKISCIYFQKIGPVIKPAIITILEAITIRILSSITPNSYLSTKEATDAEIRPHTGIDGSTELPIKNPNGRHTMAIPKLPQALFVLFLNKFHKFMKLSRKRNSMKNNRNDPKTSQNEPTISQNALFRLPI